MGEAGCRNGSGWRLTGDFANVLPDMTDKPSHSDATAGAEATSRWAQAYGIQSQGKVSPQEPTRRGPPGEWEHAELYRAVEAALMAVPAYFVSSLNVVDVDAVELYQFNTPLGGAIEKQTVRTLNSLRELWDPDSQYPDYSFARQPQRFPDVILRSESADAEPEVLLGVELKGWYALAKEREPTYRLRVNPSACNEWDLLAVYPWVFSNVVSGAPTLLRPFIREVRFAAEYKNWWWQHKRQTSADRSIQFAADAAPYPLKSSPIHDVPMSDSGNNFGRIARTGIMDDFLADTRREDAAGIPLEDWARFFALFTGT